MASQPRALFLLHRVAQVTRLAWHQHRHPKLAFDPTWCFTLEQTLTALVEAKRGATRPLDAVVVYLEGPACWTRIEAVLSFPGGPPVVALDTATSRELGQRAYDCGALASLAFEDLAQPFLGLSLQVARLRRVARPEDAHDSSSTSRTLRLRIRELKGFSKNG